MKKALFSRLLLPALLPAVLFLLCGCRVRTTALRISADTPAGLNAESLPEGPSEGTAYGSRAGSADAPDPAGVTVSADADGRTAEDPDALRKEFDENASAEILAEAERTVHGAGEGPGSASPDDDPELRVSRLDENAADQASMTVPADEAEETGVSEDAESAETALQYYSVLLKDRADSLYECKRAYVYWETVRDHVTIFKTSDEHGMILESGAYDVSARLLESNLLVDDGWVSRKAPDVIVKVVGKNVLGSEVRSAAAAEEAAVSLAARPGWTAIPAVREGRILLLSEELLTAPYLQLGAELALAKTAVPELFADVDAEEALRILVSEAAGSSPEGIFFYVYSGGN